MNLTTEEFVTHFRTLSGTTLGEKQNQLRLLLSALSPNTIATLDFGQLLPVTPLEEKLKTEALVYLQRIPDLVELLKSEDRASVKRIFKLGSWFYEKVFEHLTGSQLVDDLFPHFSYNVKIKLANKLAVHLHNTQQADDIFNAIKSKYGLNLALKLLPACSYEIMWPYIESNIKLPPRQLLSIIKKHPKLQVFNTLAKYNVKKECNKVLTFLIQNYFDSIVEIHKSFQPKEKLSKRFTRKFISNHKEQVIGNPKKYYQFLHEKQIPKTLRGYFLQFFANLYPRALEEFGGSQQFILSKLTTLPTKVDSLDLYLSTFQKLYGSELWDHSVYVTPKLLRMLTPSERASRLKIEYKKNLDEDEWMSLHKTDISIPFFLKRISLTSDIDARTELVRLLVVTCKTNEDLDGLEKVCNYILSRHRNDNIRIRLAFMRSLGDFQLENLKEAHWTCINDMIQIFDMNQESFYDKEKFEENYIHYRLKNNLLIFDQLKDRVNAKNSTMNIIKQNAEYEKFCLITFGDIISQDCHEGLYFDFLYALVNWNKRYKNDEISLFQYSKIVEYFKAEVVRGVFYRYAENISEHLLAKSAKSEYLHLYLLSGCLFGDLRILDNYVRTLPMLVVPNMEALVRFVLTKRQSSTCTFWRHCQYLDHLNIPQTMTRLCFEMWQSDVCRSENAIFALTCLMSSTEFTQLATPFSPRDSRIDSDKKRFTIQKLICKNLKNLKQVYEVFPVALHFCKSDYFKFIRASLYSMCGNIREENVTEILKSITNTSAHKHSLHIAFRTMPRDYLYNLIRELMAQSEKVAIRRFLLKALFNLFTKEPSDYHWELVKQNVEKLDVKDKESLDLFLQVEKVPANYLIAYQIFSWNFLFKLPNKGGALDSKRVTLLNSITDEGSQLLPVVFCEDIINGYLFKSEELDSLHSSVQLFTRKYVIYCKNEQEQDRRLQFVTKILKYYVDNRWDYRQSVQKTRTVCSKFVHTFCLAFLQDKDVDKSVLRKFYEAWIEIVPSRKAFGDYLFLRLTLMHSPATFLNEFVDLCQEIVSLYGIVVVDFLYTTFKEVYSNHLSQHGDDGRYEIVENLINTQLEVCLLIAILLLGDNEPDKSDIVKRHNLIIEKLQTKGSIPVHLFLNRHIRGTTTLDYY